MGNSEIHLNKLTNQIIEQLNWGPTIEWGDKEYKELSELLFNKTGVALSYTTLKRIFGRVKYENNPSTSTLDALAQYLDFENWRAFKQEASGQVKMKTESNKSLKWIVTAAIALIIIIGFTFFKSKIVSDEFIRSSRFISHTASDGFPNSVIFDLDVPDFPSSGMQIQLFWDPSRTVDLKEGQKQATGIYYFPGYFRAKLVADKTIIKEHDVYLRSNGWMATLNDKPIPEYLNTSHFYKNEGLLTVSDSVVEVMRYYKEPTYLTYHYVEPFETSADNFTLDTRIRNTLGEGSSICQISKLFILCTKGAMIIPLTKPGCVSEVNLMVGDHYRNGKEYNLSAFTCEPSEWQNMKIQVDNQRFKVLLDQDTIYEGRYRNSLGDIAGLRFAFLGAGEVDFVEIRNTDGILNFEEYFE